MDEYKSYIKISLSSERNFGLVFFIFFTLISIFPIFINEPIRIWSLILGLIFLFFLIFFPKIFKWPNKLWFKFGELISFFTSPIIMFLVYALTVIPLSLIMRIFNKDLINQKFNKKVNSYWVIRSNKMQSLKKQF